MTYMYDIGQSICKRNNRFKFNMVFLIYTIYVKMLSLAYKTFHRNVPDRSVCKIVVGLGQHTHNSDVVKFMRCNRFYITMIMFTSSHNTVNKD